MITGGPNNGTVVPLKERSAARVTAANKPMGELLRRVHGTSINRLEIALRSVFDNLDDVLFDLAEKAPSNAMQVQYFDGMRELRKSRLVIERRFRASIDQDFVDFANGVPRSDANPSGQTLAETRNFGHVETSGLSLVGDRELEESLAIAGMVAKAEGRLARPMYALNQRLAMINGAAEIDARVSPIGPTLVSEAFQRTMADVDVSIPIKLITYKLFERYVMTALEKLYDDLNAELIGAGVLPQGVPTTVAASPASDEFQRGSDLVERRAPPIASESRGNVAMPVEMFESLRSLLAQRHTLEMGSSYALRAPGGAVADTRELVEVLSLLQRQITPSYGYVGGNDNGVAEAMRIAHQLKQSLVDQVAQKRGKNEPLRPVSSADEDTIDLVGMLFEFILSDRNLPPQFQGILGRLQIPYLKVAVLDKHLFALASHPARRLLDTLARAGLSWSEEADPGHRLLDKASTVVERILEDFGDDIAIFDSERIDFEHFLDLYRKRSDIAEQRAEETARGKEKLSVARRHAADEMLKRIEGRELPSIVHDILSRPWANYLVLTLLRQGEDSMEWRNGLRFADELVWSALPKNTPRDAERLQLLLPQLETALRQGLTTIASHDDDIHRMLDELSSFYSAALAGVPVSLTSVRDVVAQAVAANSVAKNGNAAGGFNLPLPSPVEEGILAGAGVSSTTAVETPTLAENDPFLTKARGLKSGAWFEFKLDDGDFERAKLSWISPFTSNFLFVNRRGLKVAERSIQALAQEMRDGRAVLLEQAPLFDRALDAVVGRLRSTVAVGDPAAGAVLDA